MHLNFTTDLEFAIILCGKKRRGRNVTLPLSAACADPRAAAVDGHGDGDHRQRRAQADQGPQQGRVQLARGAPLTGLQGQCSYSYMYSTCV